MIAKLWGVIDSCMSHGLILNVGGVGYLVQCSQRTLSSLPGVGEAAVVHIETVVREDAFILYGFHSAAEKEMFGVVTAVQGVGAKVGLALLSVLSPDEMRITILQGVSAPLTRADGVGPKLAARIVNELKDKISKGAGLVDVTLPSGIPGGGIQEDAVAALLSLGYKRPEIMLCLSGLPADSLSLQELIRNALAQLSKKA